MGETRRRVISSRSLCHPDPPLSPIHCAQGLPRHCGRVRTAGGVRAGRERDGEKRKKRGKREREREGIADQLSPKTIPPGALSSLPIIFHCFTSVSFRPPGLARHVQAVRRGRRRQADGPGERQLQPGEDLREREMRGWKEMRGRAHRPLPPPAPLLPFSSRLSRPALSLLNLLTQEEIVREAQTMRQQAHPNILPLHCSFVHGQVRDLEREERD